MNFTHPTNNQTNIARPHLDFSAIEEFLENFTGVKFKFNSSQKKIANERVEIWRQIVKDRIVEIGKSKEKDRIACAKKLVEDGMKLFFDLPAETKPISLLIDHQNSIFEIPKDSFLNNTKYGEYKECLFNLIKSLDAEKKLFQLRDFFKSIPQNDLFSSSQHAFRTSVKSNYLFKRRTRSTR